MQTVVVISSPELVSRKKGQFYWLDYASATEIMEIFSINPIILHPVVLFKTIIQLA